MKIFQKFWEFWKRIIIDKFLGLKIATLHMKNENFSKIPFDSILGYFWRISVEFWEFLKKNIFLISLGRKIAF